MNEVIYTVHNLCSKTKEELVAIYGENYKTSVIKAIINAPEKYIIRLKNTDEAVGVFGLTHEGDKIGGIFLLTTDKLSDGNVVTFLRGAKKQINQWEKYYKLIMDNCYKKNETIKKWLKLLGFKPSCYQDENFQIYYLGNKGLYKND